MIRTVIATCIGALLAVAVLIGLWAILRWNASQAVNISPATAVQPNFAQHMVQQGYWRDRATNRWYSYWVIFQHGCNLVSGTAADAVLQCEKPLDPRLGLRNMDETP
jgi:hypothetical protein